MPKLLENGVKFKKGGSYVYFCKDCTKVWCVFWAAGKIKHEHYFDFPTYKLERRLCPDCKDKGVNYVK